MSDCPRLRSGDKVHGFVQGVEHKIGLSGILSFIGNATKYLSGIALIGGLVLLSKDIFTNKTTVINE